MPRSGAPGPPPEKRLSEMLTTHMDPQLTGSDVVTTEDGHLLTLNQVMELGKIEHKFKPTIMKKEFNWDLPADPDPKSDNYYNGIVSKELKDPINVGETLLGVINRESVGNQSDFVNEGIETILDQFGIKSDQPLTRKEKLLAFIGFKAGSMWERLVEDQSQIEPASPNPIEVVAMWIPKTNGKVC